MSTHKLNNTRPDWKGDKLDSAGKAKLIKEKIIPRLPENIKLGLEVHYDYEYNEKNAQELAATLNETGISLIPKCGRNMPLCNGPRLGDARFPDESDRSGVLRVVDQSGISTQRYSVLSKPLSRM